MQRWLHRFLRGWFDLPLTAKGTIVISIPLICILFSVAAISVLQRQRGHLDDWIARAFHAGAGIQAVVTLLSDAESGVRGFLLTHHSTYLAPLGKAEAELEPQLTHLREHLGDSTSQLQRLGRVSGLCERRLAALRGTLSASGSAAVTDRLAEGRVISEDISREFASMREEETRLWIARIVAETRLRERLSVAMYGVAILSLAAGIVAMGLFLTGIVRRAEALRQNAERLADGEPLRELAGGADEIGQVAAALARSSRLLAERESELTALNHELDRRVTDRTVQLDRAVADHRRAEEQLRQSQKMDAIGRLAGGIAHDFNNVLTIVLGFGDQLAEKIASDPEAKDDLDEILQAANHATSLTRQLLAFSRRQVIQPTALNLNAVVSRTERLLRRVIGEDIVFQTRCSSAMEPILMDEGQLEQVVMNLVVNARDAMPTGGQLIIQTAMVDLDEAYCAVHLDASPGRYALLAVCDSGLGMTPEVRDRIFEPFFTTKAKGQGTGLGLSTVYGIVKHSGGSIWVYSEPGLGTTFKIYLPLAGAVTESAPASPPTSIAPQGVATVLLVEDEPAVRKIAHQILVRSGHTVLEADGPDAARRLCRDHAQPIDLLLTDVIMPTLNGRELARELAAVYPAMKVLYMSGYTDDVITQRTAVEAGQNFIEKPFTARALSAKIRDVIGSGG
jgi:signal transduction histidine kinase